ncbi:hypothetical protein FQA39_LY04375 [Lamprigera yunnana]|nr:hypothetical protein FQA39_LY04375 [Lamprigera yunnana]
MSVSDPLIKDIKGCVLNLVEDVKKTERILDENPNLIKLCKNIEKVLSYNLIPTYNTFGFEKSSEAWTWIEKVANARDNVTFGFVSSVEEVRRYQHVLSNVGKLRLLIRNLLFRKALHVPIVYLIKNKELEIYNRNSILGNEILIEILLSLLLQCGKIDFKLDLSNTSFLDLSWELPEVVKLELVPCINLGLSISFANEKAVIINIKSNSVIAENNKVEVGDILDNLNGVHICLATKGKLNKIFKSSKGFPIKIAIIKAKNSSTNQLYKPIENLLHQVHIDPATLINKPENLENVDGKKYTSAGFKATYYGFVITGRVGDVKQIDKSIRLLLCPYRNNVENCEYKVLKKSIFFEVGEIGVKVVDSQSNIILKHSYMEISSCGSASHLPYYFAYVAGNENCNEATEFTCHIFHIKNFELAHTILQSIDEQNVLKSKAVTDKFMLSIL